MQSLKQAVARALAAGIFRPYYKIRISRPVWIGILNTRARDLYQKNQTPENTVTKQLITDLKKNGIAFTALDKLFPGKNLLPMLHAYADMLRLNARRNEKKPFLLQLWEFKNDQAVIDFNNPYVNLSLTPEVLAVVNGYMDMFAKFHYYTLNVTLPVPPGAEATKSQRWHRDNEDRKMCKMFIYLSDVDEQAGPFTYVLGSQDGGAWHKTLPATPPRSFYPPEGAVEKEIPSDAIRVGTAPAGTVIFCDTMGLHRGGYATGKERIMFTAEYSSTGSLIPLRYQYPNDFDEQIKKLSPAARFAVDSRLPFVVRLANQVSAFAVRHHLY